MHLSIGKVSTSTRYHLKNEFAYISCDWFSFTRINALKTDQLWLMKWRTTFSIEKFHIVWTRESKRHRHKSKSNDRKRNQKRNYGKWKAQKLELQNDDWLSLSTTSLFGWFFKIVQFAAWFPHSNPFWSEKIRIRKRWELSWVIPKFRSQNSDRTSVDTFDVLHLIAHRMVWWTAW